jgi:hypothetical protein
MYQLIWCCDGGHGTDRHEFRSISRQALMNCALHSCNVTDPFPGTPRHKWRPAIELTVRSAARPLPRSHRPPVLGAAVAGACELLISVDRDLLDMQKIRAIPIVRPGEYWRRTAISLSVLVGKCSRETPDAGRVRRTAHHRGDCTRAITKSRVIEATLGVPAWRMMALSSRV